jgi:hypothetical protein
LLKHLSILYLFFIFCFFRELRYSHSGQTVSGFLTLKTQDGLDEGVRVSGMAPDSQCQFAQRKVDCGVLPVGVAAEATITIINSGSNSTVFHVISMPEGEVSVFPPEHLSSGKGI